MCGRFLLDSDIGDIVYRYNYLGIECDLSAEVNNEVNKNEIFPTNSVPVIYKEDKTNIDVFRWGFPIWNKKVLINSRAETINEKGIFKESFQNRRCIIPVNAFFEWKKINNIKQKHKIYLKDIEIFSIAGIYNRFINENNEEFSAFSIVTTESNEKMRNIHNRMPVILRKNKEKNWLDTKVSISELNTIMRPYDEEDMIFLNLDRQIYEQIKIF
ncbi:SOS response-associated peptidase [Clostridium sediminicola]|uniref:SOS response-associated peptidase n=1 Tax=Clostridium sediminicola TaxID=3114879 RepID=UPI0031F1FBCF